VERGVAYYSRHPVELLEVNNRAIDGFLRTSFRCSVAVFNFLTEILPGFLLELGRNMALAERRR